MNCQFWRSSLVEVARGHLCDVNDRHATMSHATACADCNAFFEEQMALTAAMKAMAAESDTAAPAALESAVLAEFLSNRRQNRRWLAYAAAIALIAGSVAWRMSIPYTRVASAPDVAQPAPSIGEPAPIQPAKAPLPNPVIKAARRHSPKPRIEEPPFVAIPYTMPLQPWESATVMRMEMPATALAAVGLTVAIPDPRASAQTDVIVGQDGRIRAIRLLSISTSSTDRSINQ